MMRERIKFSSFKILDLNQKYQESRAMAESKMPEQAQTVEYHQQACARVCEYWHP